MGTGTPLTGIALGAASGDVDLGIPPIVARDRNLVGRLKDLNYLQIAGNRFAQRLSDIPAGMKEGGNSGDPEALIDVLIPAYTSRARENVPAIASALGQRLSAESADARITRIRALIARVLGPTRAG